MRIALVLPLVLTCGLALPALAQTAPDKSTPTAEAAKGATTDAVDTRPRASSQDQDAAAALAMTIRQREIQEQRIARIACAAGDKAKCQMVKAVTTASTASP